MLVQANPRDPDNFPFVVLGNKIDVDDGKNKVVSGALGCQLDVKYGPSCNRPLRGSSGAKEQLSELWQLSGTALPAPCLLCSSHQLQQRLCLGTRPSRHPHAACTLLEDTSTTCTSPTPPHYRHATIALNPPSPPGR